ncbi:MAG: CoA-binding protein [Proteobacteria bacterium]|nr:CoA-binding protein [Pseudomonadota bacterium]
MEQETHFLDLFFNPRSVAIVGASDNRVKPSFMLMNNMVRAGFTGRLYPVNPTAETVAGVKAYPDLDSIPETVDLVISAVSPGATLEVVRRCAATGIRRVVVVSGGFSDSNDEGRRLEAELAALVLEKGLYLVGPNTLSPVNTRNRLIVSFNPAEIARPGGASFIFQSGFYDARLSWICERIGANKVLDTGNKMAVTETDALEYMARDPSTRIIGLHLESLRGDARRFFQLLGETARRKPVVILKSGRTAAGARAAASHTGSMALENDVIFHDAIRQAGAVWSETAEDFFDVIKAFSFLEPLSGDRLAVITQSGGEGVLTTDACELNGLRMAELSPAGREALAGAMPNWEVPANPFDYGLSVQFHLSDLPRFFGCMRSISADENVDATLMAIPPGLLGFMHDRPDSRKSADRRNLETLAEMLAGLKSPGKPFVMWQSNRDAAEDETIRMLESRGIPVFDSSFRAIRALAAMSAYFKRFS